MNLTSVLTDVLPSVLPQVLRKASRLATVIGVSSLFAASSAYAMKVGQLDRAMKRGDKITIIDIRPKASYQRGHIQNSINIPAALINKKRLPHLGDVVVVGDGIDDEMADQAVEALNEKPGIDAELLKGGFAKWTSKHSAIGNANGLADSGIREIGYKKLERKIKKGRSPVLVDLRLKNKKTKSIDSYVKEIAGQDHDIEVIKPRIKKVKGDDASPMRAVPKLTKGIIAAIPKDNNKLVVLIDDGNGFAERVGVKLHAAGVKRIAVLVGGVLSFESKGKPTDRVRTTISERRQ